MSEGDDQADEFAAHPSMTDLDPNPNPKPELAREFDRVAGEHPRANMDIWDLPVDDAVSPPHCPTCGLPPDPRNKRRIGPAIWEQCPTCSKL